MGQVMSENVEMVFAGKIYDAAFAAGASVGGWLTC